MSMIVPADPAPGEILDAQRAAFRREGPPSYGRRRDALDALDAVLRRERENLAAAIAADFGGRSPLETGIMELFPVLEELRHVRRHLRAWMAPRRAATAWPFWPARSHIHYRPLGVVGIIGAWNYPLLLVFSPLIAALAAGNRVMIKAPRLVPHTASLLADLLGSLFSGEEVAVLRGGADLSTEFPTLPFDHLVFAGSTRVGRLVARAAARNLTPVTLSLSGKTPAIVHHDYPMRRAAERIMAGKLLNAGQTCVAPDYVFVHESRSAEFIRELERAACRLYPRLLDNPDYTRIPNPALYARLAALVDDARTKGAEVLLVNPAAEVLDPAGGVFPPTLLWNLKEGMTVLEEEIFGPVLPVLTYETLEGALAYVADRPDPLAFYYFDNDETRIGRVVQGTRSGGITINDTVFHVAQPGLPFGGIGASGMGQLGGYHGFVRFTQPQAVFRQLPWSACALIRPPYGRRARALMHLLLRRFP